MTDRISLAPRWLNAGLALALGLTTLSPAFGFQDPPPPPDRLFSVLDKDRDGTLSAGEIRDAAESLKKLDLDHDGTLSRDELAPPRPPRGGRRPDGPARREDSAPSASATVVRNPDGSEKIPLVFQGGHETDPVDRGRPVALVAGALGIKPEVFRDAFSKVKPAPAGTSPTPEHARKNKAVLMAALGPLGITNEQIDRASNHYRYVQSRGEMWPTREATGHATVKDGALVSVVITEPGSGYNTPPTVTIPGHPAIALEAKLTFSKDLDANGSIASVKAAGQAR